MSKVEHDEAKVERGDRVEVHEPNTKPWRGVAGSVKWSARTGWWVDIRRDGEGWATWAIAQDLVRVLPREAEEDD